MCGCRPASLTLQHSVNVRHWICSFKLVPGLPKHVCGIEHGGRKKRDRKERINTVREQFARSGGTCKVSLSITAGPTDVSLDKVSRNSCGASGTPELAITSHHSSQAKASHSRDGNALASKQARSRGYSVQPSQLIATQRRQKSS